MEKKVLSEIALYYGDIAMPKGFEIDRNKLQDDILKSQINNKEFPYSRSWDMLNTYIREHIELEYDFNFVTVAQWGPRKNMENTIRGFVEEFHDEEVGLVLKTSISKIV